MPNKAADSAIPLLAARDLSRQMAFYSRLGFKLLGPGAAPDPYVIAKLGAFEVHLWQTKKAKTGMAYLRISSVRKIHARFAKLGLPLRGTPSLSAVVSESWGMKECRLVDPEGNLLRIGEFI